MRGRGRYGATPHPKTARLEIVLQERQNGGFKKRTEEDPLEWIRMRLRNRKKDHVSTAEEIYREKRLVRPIKPIYA